LKRIMLVTVVLAGLLGVRVAIATPHWAACTGNGGQAAYLSLEHLGAPPSAGDCLLLGLGRALTSPATTEPAVTFPVSVPPPSLGPGGWVDPGYGTKSCAEGGCTVHGPCPGGVPPISHYDCTTTTLDPEVACAQEIKADAEAWARWSTAVDRSTGEAATQADQDAADRAWDAAGRAQDAEAACRRAAQGG